MQGLWPQRLYGISFFFYCAALSFEEAMHSLLVSHSCTPPDEHLPRHWQNKPWMDTFYIHVYNFISFTSASFFNIVKLNLEEMDLGMWKTNKLQTISLISCYFSSYNFVADACLLCYGKLNEKLDTQLSLICRLNMEFMKCVSMKTCREGEIVSDKKYGREGRGTCRREKRGDLSRHLLYTDCCVFPFPALPEF